MTAKLCSKCGKLATHETYTAGEYVCDSGDCLLELAIDGYLCDRINDEE